MRAIFKFAVPANLGVLSGRIPGQLRKFGVWAGAGCAAAAFVLGMSASAWAQTKTATTTTLSVTAGGAAATSVAPGTVVTLTASVKAGTTAVTVGQVNFCDASAADCLDIHLLGTVAVTSSGIATYKFVPGPGAHSYKALFVGTKTFAGSASAALSLTVGPAPNPVYSDTTSISVGGYPGDYSLTATVEGFGGSASPTGNVSFLDTSFANTSLATAALGSSIAGTGWLISQTPDTGSNPISEVAGDFNGDGIPDLAVLWGSSISSGPFSVTILFGKGDGTFTTGPTVQPAGVQLYPTMIGGDFNGDDKADLVILSYNGYSISYVTALLGNGDGTFVVSQTDQVYNQSPTGGDVIPGSMVAADFNGDGKLDLAVVGDYVSSGGVTILLGNGDGTFTAAGPNLDPTADFGLIATGDFNGDGIPDLVATNVFEDGSNPVVFLGKGDGTFTATAASFTLTDSPASVLAGDFNGDGVLDLAFSDLNGIEIALGNGDGTFKETSASPISVPIELVGLVLGDFNHDGKLDIAGIDYVNGFSGNVLLIGAGDGTFTAEATTLSTNQNSDAPFVMLAADFNGDGVPDLATLTPYVDTASILLTEPTQTATATVNNLAPIGAGTHNVEASYPGDSNYPASVSATVALAAGVAPPAISPAAGTFTSAQSITITDTTPGAAIYYAASGAFATNGFVLYTGPIPLEGTGPLSVLVYATETGYQQSEAVSYSYVLNFASVAATPVISLASGSYANAQTVTISDSTPGAQIYYTTNGTYPFTDSNLYSGPITVSTSEVLAAIAFAPGYAGSGNAIAQYYIASSSSRFIYTIAGSETLGYSGDAGPATFAELSSLLSVAVDSAGNVYVADQFDNVVRKVAASTGIITTIAGTGVAGHTGDNGPAASAELSSPGSLALDPAGNLFIGEDGDIRRIDATTGQITTFAGNPAGTGSIGGPAIDYPISETGIACDSLGNLYIAEYGNVLEVRVATGNITLIAGTSTNAGFGYLIGIAVDNAQNIYVSDFSYNEVWKINSAGAVTVFAGNRAGGIDGDGGLATNARLNGPQGIAVDTSGNVYIADASDNAVREVNPAGIINTVAGVLGGPYTFTGDGSPATEVGLNYPQKIALDKFGNLYLTDGYRIREVTAPAPPPSKVAAVPVLSLAAGTYSGSQILTMTDATPGAEIYVSLNGSAPTTAGQGYHGPIDITGTVTVQAVALAPGYVASAAVSATFTITTPPSELISTVAGTGTYGFSTAGGPATSANMGQPEAVAFDGSGNLYIADIGNYVVWKVAASTGNISIVAGTGTPGPGTDGGQATASELGEAEGVAVDKAGNLYIADASYGRVRMVTAANWRHHHHSGSRRSLHTWRRRSGNFGLPGISWRPGIRRHWKSLHCRRLGQSNSHDCRDHRDHFDCRWRRNRGPAWRRWIGNSSLPVKPI